METQDKAYLLHARPLSDSRKILQLFTENHGRISVVIRRTRATAKHTPVQQFCPLACAYFGNNELKTATYVDANGPAPRLVGEPLYCGMYMNELLTRGLPPDEPHTRLFYAYERALVGLAAVKRHGGLPEILRCFELELLANSGYAIDFEFDVNGQKISELADSFFIFTVGEGFSQVVDSDKNLAYTGRILSLIQQQNWQNDEARLAAKAICRRALKQLIGEKPLKSRELYYHSRHRFKSRAPS